MRRRWLNAQLRNRVRQPRCRRETVPIGAAMDDRDRQTSPPHNRLGIPLSGVCDPVMELCPRSQCVLRRVWAVGGARLVGGGGAHLGRGAITGAIHAIEEVGGEAGAVDAMTEAGVETADAVWATVSGVVAGVVAVVQVCRSRRT